MSKYIKELVSEWGTVAFLIVDVVLFIISATTQTFILPTETYWVIALIGFIVANFRIYSKQQQRLEELGKQEANIRLRVISSTIQIKAPILVMDQNRIKDSRSADGLDDFGVPVVVRILADIEVENTGYEKGEFVWKIDPSKSDAPKFISLIEKSVNGYFDSESKTSLEVSPRDRFETRWILPILFKVEDPKELAKALSKPDGYNFHLMYKTKRVGGETEERILEIEGNLDSLKENLIKKWTKRELGELVSLANGVDFEQWSSF